MIFQASDDKGDKGRHFLDLLNNNLCPIEPSYTKGGSWIKYFCNDLKLELRLQLRQKT